MLDQTIGFIGAGRMARALAGGFVRADLVGAGQVIAADPDSTARTQFSRDVPGCLVTEDNMEVLGHSNVVFLSVKPQNISTATATLRAGITDEKLIVSIAAGVTLGRLTSELGTERIVRVMPNTPCLVGRSASGYCLAPGATEADGRLVDQLLDSVGMGLRLEEKLLDAVTGLSGSGPAFVYLVIEALTEGGVQMGLSPDEATALAAQTVCGAAQMVQKTGKHPGILINEVTSPGGTTVAGLQVLKTNRVREAFIAAVEAATRRSTELGRD